MPEVPRSERARGDAAGEPGPARVLRLGDPRLRRASEAVGDPRRPEVRARAACLRATLRQFRAEHGFGRAIAAPQIGVPLRFVALELEHAPPLVFDPEIVWRSGKTLTLWDDCMSFPHLLVRVCRHRSVTVAYTGADGGRASWPIADPETSELLQHEIDHLDGVLAIDRAAGPGALVTRAEYERDRDRLRARVDLPGPPARL